MISIDEYFVFFTCGFGVIIATGLFVRPLNLRNAFLAAIIFFAAYVQFVSNLITSKLIYNVPSLMYTQVPSGFFLSPFIYVYVSSFLREKPYFRKNDLLFFIPAILFSIVSLKFIFASTAVKVDLIDGFYRGLTPLHLLAAVAMIILISYLIVLLIKLRGVFHRENPLHRKIFAVITAFFLLVLFILLKIAGMFYKVETLWRLVNFAFGLVFIHLYFLLQRFPVILSYGSMGAGSSTFSKSSKKQTLLDSIDINTLTKSLEIMMLEEKLFCDEDLTLGRLAHALEISPHQLSAFLNKTYKKNYNAFINEYRIAYARSILDKDPEASTLSVAFASGFNSYSAFFSAFKKVTGRSPGDYKSKK